MNSINELNILVPRQYLYDLQIILLHKDSPYEQHLDSICESFDQKNKMLIFENWLEKSPNHEFPSINQSFEF